MGQWFDCRIAPAGTSPSGGVFALTTSHMRAHAIQQRRLAVAHAERSNRHCLAYDICVSLTRCLVFIVAYKNSKVLVFFY